MSAGVRASICAPGQSVPVHVGLRFEVRMTRSRSALFAVSLPRAARALAFAGLCATLSVVGPTLASAQSRPPEQPTATAVRLADQRVELREVAASGTNVRAGRATALVDAPAALVRRVVEDYARYAEFLPNFKASRVLSQRGAQALVYLEASVLHNTTTLWAQMRLRPRAPVTNADGTTTWRVEATMVSGNVERMAALWELTALEGGARTLVSFEFLVEPDLPFPASIMTDQNVASARRTIGRLRARMREPRFAVAAR
jgi:ribosome-associated toxin RatA of RatAB toxin-antitoxin module